MKASSRTRRCLFPCETRRDFPPKTLPLPPLDDDTPFKLTNRTARRGRALHDSLLGESLLQNTERTL